jgi:YHS domain-containing protein
MTAEPAMGGYCPVTFREKGAWVRGRYDERVEIDGVVFFTAGAAERDALLADPAKYMPVLAGNCAVSLVDDAQQARGSTFHAAQFEGRLFLFADAERKATFKEQPLRYASIDVAASGACVVTLKDGGKNTPGLAEYAVWYNGLLYRFLGPDEKAKFLATPDKYAEQ